MDIGMSGLMIGEVGPPHEGGYSNEKEFAPAFKVEKT